jgi:predicted metal-dependent peptidase
VTAHLRRIDALSVQARQQWAAARVWAAAQAPYLASAVLAVDPVVVDQSESAHRFDLRALPVDQSWHVYLDPDVLTATEVPQLGFWLLHQVTHLLRRHADRFAAARAEPDPTASEQRRWTLAADAEINDALHTDELRIPSDATTPGTLELPDGWIAEQYWDALGGPERDLQSDRPDCGTGCDGQPRPWNVNRPGLGAAERALLERDVARRIREHQRSRGSAPSGWQRWAEEVLEPSVDWRQVLRSAVRHGIADAAGKVDFTYRRPSRRAAAVPGVVLPSLRQPLPTVAVVIDTSGSMSDAMLEQVLGEVSGMLKGVGIGRRNLHVVCCDAQTYETQRVLDAHDVQLLGGGGTDLRVGLAAATATKPRPDVIIVLTDGHTPWPADRPAGCRVVVGLMDQTGATPDWAVTVPIEVGSP